VRRLVLITATLTLVAAYVARGYLVPHWVNAKVEAEDRAATDIAPKAAAAVDGIIGIVKAGGPDSFHKANICEMLCESLLYSGKASAVITAPSIDGNDGKALKWTIDKRDLPCESSIDKLSNGYRIWEGLPDKFNEMTDRALLGDCIIGRPGHLRDASIVIEHETLGRGKRVFGELSDLPIYPELSGGRLSLWRFSEEVRPILLARETWRNPRRLTQFLHREFNGSVNSPAMEWTRAEETNKIGPWLPEFQLARFLEFNTESIVGAEPDGLRRALDNWLDHPELESPELAQQLSARVLPLMRGETLQADDLERYKRLIRDPRTSEQIVTNAVKAFTDRAIQLREVVFQRMERVASRSNDNYIYDRVLGDFPPGAFKYPSPQNDGVAAGPRKGSSS